MAIYDHVCEACNHEWEDEYSIKEDPPKECPKCGKETVKRLISLCGKGVVELYGQDLVDKCKADAKQMKKDSYKNENLRASLIGEDKYHKMQSKR